MAIDLGKLTKSICLQCGSEAYKHKGKVHKLCAPCELEAIINCVEYNSNEKCELVYEKIIDAIPSILSLKKEIQPFERDFHRDNSCWCGNHFYFYIRQQIENYDAKVARDAKEVLMNLTSMGWYFIYSVYSVYKDQDD